MRGLIYEKLPSNIEVLVSKEDLTKCLQVVYEVEKGTRRNNARRGLYTFFNSIKDFKEVVNAFKKYTIFNASSELTSPQKMYSIEYNSLKHNVTLEEAEVIVQNIKKNKATNLKGFIQRHGIGDGKALYKKATATFRNKQDYVRTLPKEEQKAYYRKNSRRCFEFYLTRGLASNLQEAQQLANKYQKMYAGVSKFYYINKGFTEEQIKDITDKINAKKGLGSSHKEIQRRFPDSWEEILKQRREKLRETLGCIPEEQLPIWKKYALAVDRYTKISCRDYFNEISNLDKRSREWQLDHKFSKFQGFINNVCPKIVGHYKNLEILSNTENASKQDTCSISLENLYLIIKNTEANED